jgi:CRP/FNR family cyclic AMP-dependent transcriptional regulator
MHTINAPTITPEQSSTHGGTTGPFANLRGQALARFKAVAHEVSYAHGYQLFLEGEEPEHVFILTSGRVKLSVTSREGKMIILRIAGEDQCLGLAAALAHTPHEVSAEVLEPCKATVICVTDFMDLLADHPEMAMEATRCILAEYQATFSGMCRLALPATVAGRLANLLLEWRDSRIQRGAEGQRLTVALTHGEIAEMANTSRETVSRVFQQFQRDKLIAVKGSSVTVLQPQALEQLAW